ncbi:unnamed protein product, partial [Tenebrio molitor]
GGRGPVCRTETIRNCLSLNRCDDVIVGTCTNFYSDARQRGLLTPGLLQEPKPYAGSNLARTEKLEIDGNVQMFTTINAPGPT